MNAGIFILGEMWNQYLATNERHSAKGDGYWNCPVDHDTTKLTTKRSSQNPDELNVDCFVHHRLSIYWTYKQQFLLHFTLTYHSVSLSANTGQ